MEEFLPDELSISLPGRFLCAAISEVFFSAVLLGGSDGGL